jgi:hypothetical protein
MATISDLTRILGTLASKVLFSQLVAFWRACTVVKEQILLVFPSTQPPEETPPRLPPHVREFLKLTTAMSDDVLVQVWQAMGEMVWSPEHHLESVMDDRAVMDLFDRAAHPIFRESADYLHLS